MEEINCAAEFRNLVRHHIWEQYPSQNLSFNPKEEDSVLNARRVRWRVTVSASGARSFQTRTIFYGGFCARIRYIL
jgi:hypothetical protein